MNYLKGKTFGRLTVIGEKTELIEGKTGYYWLCKCDCGVVKHIPQTCLRKGGTKTCGCARSDPREITSPRRIKRKEFTSWKSMKARCYDEKHENFARYGGRGITVCDRWLESFHNFFDDMGYKPTPKHTIERDNTNGNYEPSNCRWATNLEQQNNKSTTKIVSFQGSNIPLANLCREQNALYSRVRWRIKGGMSVDEALNTPNMRTKKSPEEKKKLRREYWNNWYHQKNK